MIAAIAVFVVLLKVMRAAEVGTEAIRVARAAAATMSDRGLSDDEKEAQVRRAARRMFRNFLVITMIGAVALALPAAIIWVGSLLGLYTIAEVTAVATGWRFLLAATVGSVLIWLALERWA